MQIPSTGANPYAAPSAQTSPSQGSSGQTPGAPKADTAVADFLAYANMTPAEKMRAAILGSLGVTESDLSKMDPKDRAKLEEKIKEMIKEKVEQSTEKQTGVAVDLKV